MENYIKVLTTLRSTNSRVEKEQILSQATEELDYFRDILIYTYDQSLVYGVNKNILNKIHPSKGTPSTTNSWELFKSLINSLLDSRVERTTRIQEFANSITESDWNNLYKLILLKNLDCGVGISTAKKFVSLNIFSVSLCQTIESLKEFDTSKNNRWVVEPKLDGVRCLAVIREGNCTLFSRNGKTLENFPHINHRLTVEFQRTPMVVLDGELTSNNFQSLMKKLYSKNIDSSQTLDTSYHIFDAIPYPDFFSGKSDIPYFVRRRILDRLVTQPSDCIEVVPTYRFSTTVGLESFFEDFLDQGFEGAILKDLDSPYLCKRNSYWLKIKPVRDYSLTLISVEEGEGKYRGQCGALVGLYSDGGVEFTVSVGTGISDENRIRFWSEREELINSLTKFDISADGFTENKNSFRFPRFLRLREDL